MTAVPGTIRRMSLRDQVLTVLRERLVSGEFAPGEIYSAQAVAAELGVSGSPVREAMLTLVGQGLMEPVRNRGFMVVEMTDKDRADIFEMRLWLEVPAMARLAKEAHRVDPVKDEYRGVAEEIIAAAESGDITGYLEADRRFHLGLLDLLGNARLTAAISDLRDQTRLYGLERLKQKGTLVDSAQEHLEILDSLLASDTKKTKDLMTRHMAHVLGKWAGHSPR